MGYYEDLTPYEYAGYEPDGRTVNVGWLSGVHPFNKGETPEAFRARLLNFCVPDHLVRLMRGFHICEFCDFAEAWSEKRSQSMGNGEIRVIGEGVVYAAPTMIYHYVTEHGYRPPDAFIGAVLNGPGPDSEEHRALRARIDRTPYY